MYVYMYAYFVRVSVSRGGSSCRDEPPCPLYGALCTYVCMLVYVFDIHTHTNTTTHTHIPALFPHSVASRQIHTLVHEYTHTHTHTQAGMSCMYMHIHTCHTHTQHTHTRTHAHAHVHTHIISPFLYHKTVPSRQISIHPYIHTYIHTHTHTHTNTRTQTYLHRMVWLRFVGSFKSYVSFAEYRFFYRALLQKRPIILRSLLTKATPYWS